MNILEFQNRKKTGKKISMVVCYDYLFATIIAQTEIDCVLVGDSAAQIMHGHETTIPATVPLMAMHIEAVKKGINKQLIIGDLPFLSYRKGLQSAMEAIETLMRAGAQAIKLEGAFGNLELIHHAVESGIPIMGHIGLMPQSVHALGGLRIQAKEQAKAESVLQQALELEKAGCFGVVLECIPNELAERITEQLTIPTIGIGAGPHVDGQVLVLHDLLGLNHRFKPKFLKHYLNGFDIVQTALNRYDEEVKTLQYPNKEYQY